ncbi:MAG: Ig-like domain-containing protein, partial [Actinomycetota bacterium]
MTTPFGPELNVADLDGSTGFVVNGAADGDDSGRAISGIGDINNDGIADFIVGAPQASPNDTARAGAAYVVFGDETLGSNGSIDLATIDGSNGFVLAGLDAGDNLGFAVSDAGDVNDDGIADLIVSAPRGNLVRGESYVVFGRNNIGGSGSVDLANLDGEDGFVVNGIDGNEFSGNSVSSIGDLNGDGIDDLVVGAPEAGSPGTIRHGRSYVVFGSADIGEGGSLDAVDLTGEDGFIIRGSDRAERAGSVVSAAGDVNNDGFIDILIGAPTAAPNGLQGAGKAYVVYGGADVGSGGDLDLGTLDGANGFAMAGANFGDRFGSSVSNLGDVNGDGIDDFIIGSPFTNINNVNSVGESYVVFGREGLGGNGNLDITALDGSTGFVIRGVGVGDNAGTVSRAGDINNDGVNDLLIGALGANPGGNGSPATGQAYVVFGGSDLGSSGSLELADIDGNNGFAINGLNRNDRFGEVLSDIGDVNNDGIDDLIVSAPKVNNNDGFDDSYVIFGFNGSNATPVPADDAFTTDEDSSLTLDVLANDSDPENDPLTISSVTQPTNGSVIINADNTLNYTPDADFNGTDSFTYQVDDGNGGRASATVSLTVNPVNDAPVANNDSANTNEDTAVTVEVLANDSDIDGDTLSVGAVGDAANGTVVLNADGTVTYTPDTGFSGNDSFTYELSDGDLSDTATVSVFVGDVNDAPVAADDSNAITEDSVPDVSGNVLTNDSDPDGDVLTVTSVAGNPIGAEPIQGQYGTLAVNTDGSYTYTLDNDNPAVDALNDGETLTETFDYTVSDGDLQDTAQLDITINGSTDATPPVINFSTPSVSVAEGDQGDTPMTFQVTRSGSDLSEASTVSYSIRSTGLPNPANVDDFAEPPQVRTLEFAPGQTEQTITIDIAGDRELEADENFEVILANPTNGVIGPTDRSAGTILNDDTVVSMGTTSVIQTEGNQGTTPFQFQVNRTGDLDKTTTVTYSLFLGSDGQATADDFLDNQFTGEIEFTPGQTTQTITLQVVGDTNAEVDETFGLNLFTATNGMIDPNNRLAIGTILNDDPPALSIFEEDGSIVEGARSARYRIEREGDLSQATTVDVTVRGAGDNPASAADFPDNQFPSRQITFAPGEDTAFVGFRTQDDDEMEPSEGFQVVLSNPSNGAIVKTTSSGIIIDNDTPPSPNYAINALTPSQFESDAGTVTFDFAIDRRNASAAGASEVIIEIVGTGNNPATSDDFLFPIGQPLQVDFAAGQSQGIVSIAVTGDTQLEADETFEVRILSTSDGFPIVRPTATATILNDEQHLAITPANADQAEGTDGTTPFTFTVTRTGFAGEETTVDYRVRGVGNPAANGDDFGGTLPTGTVTFAEGETSQTITLDVAADAALEGDESFEVLLSNASGKAEITVDTATGTIRNDDMGGGTIAVTEATDNGTGQTVGTLSWAIQEANERSGIDTIELQTDVRLNFAANRMRMESLIDSDLVIEGNGFTISGDNNNNGQVDIGDVDINRDGVVNERDADRPVFFVR